MSLAQGGQPPKGVDAGAASRLGSFARNERQANTKRVGDTPNPKP